MTCSFTWTGKKSACAAAPPRFARRRSWWPGTSPRTSVWSMHSSRSAAAKAGAETTMPDCVIDASAMLALVKNETGAEYVRERIARSLASAVNLAEVGAVLSDWGLSDDEIRTVVIKLGVENAPFDIHQAHLSAELRRATRSAGLSLGDRACLALAKSTALPALTADRTWLRAGVDVKIDMIRD